MNHARVAQLLRELADAFEEEAPGDQLAQARAKKSRRTPMLTRPEGEAPEAVSGQARRILRERGLV